MTIFKRKTLRDKCRDLYGDDFVFQYDLLCSGVPIGSMDETISFLKDIDAAQKVSNKTRRRLKKDKLLYDEGFHDGKRDAVKWHEWGETPEKGGKYLILLTNTWSRVLGIEVGTYDAIFEEWTFPQEGDETPRYWMRLPEPPEWNPEWDKDLLVDVEEENE